MTYNSINHIQAPEGAVFVGEFLDTLPVGILNKKKTGCGATSVALENNENTIVCCPTVQLIKNKVSQYPNKRCKYNLLGVIAGIQQSDIHEYIKQNKNEQPVKIMVTYDSFYKVKKVIGENINQYKIIIDEYHELLDACIYREKAVLSLLSEVKGLCNVTYISATPTPLVYRPDELTDLVEHEILWHDNDRIAPHRYKTNKPYALVSNMIQTHEQGSPLEINGQKVQEYFFFLNSVTAIKNIIDQTGLTDDNTKVICANTTENTRKLDNITISDSSPPNKTFTFCTKTVFCGADFYSEAGLAVVVSCGTIKSTLLDISTDIQQIAGRIRTPSNPFKNIVLHIYSTRSTLQTQSEFVNWLNDRVQSAQGIIDAYNTLQDEVQKKSIVERIKLNDRNEELALYDEESNEIKLNTLKINHFKYKFESIEETYRNGMSIRDAYLKAGYDLSVVQQWVQIISDYTYNMNGTSNFKSLYLEYLKEKKNAEQWGGVTDRTKEIERKNELVELAYRYLTPQRVKALRYNSTDIRDAVHFELPETQNALKAVLKEKFIEGGEYTNEDAKALYQDSLDILKINKRAKVMELKNRYFEAIDVKINENGKRKGGIKILRIVNFLFGYSEHKQIEKPNTKRKTIKKIMSFFSVKKQSS